MRWFFKGYKIKPVCTPCNYWAQKEQKVAGSTPAGRTKKSLKTQWFQGFFVFANKIPSSKRPSAGLDYRYALVINDTSNIEFQTEKKIPKSQYDKIFDYPIIQENQNQIEWAFL